MRKLASIQRIKDVSPIEGADAIEKITVLGWNLVAKKGEFKAGDMCVYIEIDSVLPEVEPFLFMKPRGMRVRTIRLRGQVSQGICFPLSILDNNQTLKDLDLREHEMEDMDVTEHLGITKYDPPIPANLAGTVKGSFPSFLLKTDETRIQNLQHILDRYKGQLFYSAEKLDGSSVTMYINNGEFGICSRTLELKETEGNTLWRIAREQKIEEKLRALNTNCAIQGEVIGEGIQKNKYKLKGQEIRFFNFFDIDKYRYADFQEFVAVMVALELSVVPLLDTKFELINDIEALVKLSVGQSVLNKDTKREGIVLRPLTEILDSDSNGQLHADRLSFKVINPEFLIKYEE